MGVEINMAAHAVSGIASPPQPCHQLCRPAAACPSASNVECNVPTDALRLDRAPGPRAWAARLGRAPGPRACILSTAGAYQSVT